MQKEVLIIIPARGGSKGTPQKNIKMFMGHPLIAHSITAAFFCRYAARVVVSTDCYETAEIAKRYGAEVPFLRPAELATDTSRDIEFSQHVLDNIDGADRYGYIVILRPTSPIRPHGFVNKGILQLVDTPDADSLRAVTDAPATPYKMWHRRGAKLAPILSDPEIPEAYNAPRQELPKVFWQTGHLDVIRRETIENGSITGGYVLPLYIEPKYCVDIDTPQDFLNAETVFRKFPSTEIVQPCHPSPGCHPRHTVGYLGTDAEVSHHNDNEQETADTHEQQTADTHEQQTADTHEQQTDAFDAVEISTKRAAGNKENRCQTKEEMARVECSAEQRDPV